MQEVSRVTRTLQTRVASYGGGSLSQRWQLSELNQRVRGASRRAVNKSERRASCATDS